jgi:hypothetical protein
LPVELPEQPVLAQGQSLWQLLQRVVDAVELDEADDVPADPPLDLDQPLLGPVLQREPPRQVEERPLALAREQAEVGVGASAGNGGDR